MSDERPENEGGTPPNLINESSSEDELATNDNLEARIAEAKRRRDELKQQKQLKKINQEISQLEKEGDSNGSTSSSEPDEEVPRRPEEIGSMEPVISRNPAVKPRRRKRDDPESPEPHLPKLRSQKLKEYFGKTVREHREWTRDAQTAFRQAEAYFPNEGSKILFAMGSLRGDPKEMWYNYEETHPVHTLTWDDFKTFLLNRIEDPVNRSLEAVQRYEDAHQLQSQTVQQFNAYLEGVEAQLSSPYTEPQRVTQFFAKIRPELQIQITNVGTDLPNTKGALLALASRLEANVRKTNPNYAKGKNNQSSQGGQGNNKKRKRDKDNDDESRGENHGHKKNKRNKDKDSQSNREPKDGSKKDKDGKKDHSHLTCYNCGKPGHIAPNCPEPKKEQPKVGGVTQMGDYEVTFRPKNEKPSSKTP